VTVRQPAAVRYRWQRPQCGSAEIGPSFTFDYDRDDSGRVIARNPFFACAGCEHAWQVEMVLMVAKPFDPDDDQTVNGFVGAINKEAVDAG